MSKLLPCPCGQTPTHLGVTGEHDRAKLQRVSGACCGIWEVEFRSEYTNIGTPENVKIATVAWNDAPRAMLAAAPSPEWLKVDENESAKLYEGGGAPVEGHYELMPCPFCDGPAKVFAENCVGCADWKCGAQIDFGHWYGNDNGVPAVFWVVQQWNKRAKPRQEPPEPPEPPESSDE